MGQGGSADKREGRAVDQGEFNDAEHLIVIGGRSPKFLISGLTLSMPEGRKQDASGLKKP